MRWLRTKIALAMYLIGGRFCEIGDWIIPEPLQPDVTFSEAYGEVVQRTEAVTIPHEGKVS